MAKTGRPTSYTPEIAAKICEMLAAGLSLRAICQEPRMPHESTVRQKGRHSEGTAMIRIKGLKWCVMVRLCTFFGLTALAFSQPRPLDNITSRQYQHEVRPLRLALDGWLHELGLQELGLSIRLVKASDLPPNSCGMSTYDIKGLFGEIDVLRSDEYANLPGCLDGVDIPKDQLNTVIHEVMHMVLDLPVTNEAKVVAISEVIQPHTRKRK